MTVTADGDSRKAARRRSLETIIDFAIASHARAVVVLLAVALLGFLPGFFSIPPVDQDEGRYKKPVGIYWLQAAAVKTATSLGLPHALTTIWLYRIPSLLGAVGAVLLTYWAGLAFVSRRAALLAGLMMASCVLLGAERLLAKTDATLLVTVVAAMGAMARVYLPPPGDPRDARA